MAKSAKQRQLEYRERRKAAGLCAWPGCDRKPRKYALCPDHRADARLEAQVRTGNANDLQYTMDQLTEARKRISEVEAEVKWLQKHMTAPNVHTP